MKKFIFTALAVVAFSGVSLASVNVVKAETEVQTEKVLIVDVKYPSGSGTITDSCGHVYDIEWSCNFDCDYGSQVFPAIQAFAETENCDLDNYDGN